MPSSSSTLSQLPGNKGSATLSSALTEERLRDFNGRGRHDGPSPYYKGLTDSALALRDLSPGRETYATGSTGARSFSSTVLIRFQEWGTFCFSRRGRDDDDEHEATRAKTTSDGGGRRCSLCGSPRVEESMEPGAGAGRCPAKPLDVRPSSEGLPAEANQKPERERVVAEPAPGDPVVRGGRKPLRESTSAPRVSIPEPWKDEKPSASESAEPVGPPPASGSPPAPRQAREFYDPRVSSGGGPTEAPAAVMVTAGEGKKERAFVWAERYRPRALEDFICNRTVATELREKVREASGTAANV